MMENVKADKHIDVSKEFCEEITGTISVNVSADRQENTSNLWAHDAGQEIHVKAAKLKSEKTPK